MPTLDLLLQSIVSHDSSEIISICWFGGHVTIIIIIAEILDSATAFKLIFASKCFASHSYQKNRWFLCVFLLFE